MMMRLTRCAALALAIFGIAACSSEQGTEASFPRLVFDSARQVVQERRAGPQPVVVVTPQMLAETTVAALQVNPEDRGGSDFLRRAATRNDSARGTVEIWRASDNAQIFLRNGVIVGTRGVGGDIISSDAAATVGALQSRQSRRGIREYLISDGDVTTTLHRFNCEIENRGGGTIAIVNQTFGTTHMRETCVGGPSSSMVVSNDYWVENGTGLVRKSRQWAGQEAGYFELVLLKN